MPDPVLQPFMTLVVVLAFALLALVALIGVYDGAKYLRHVLRSLWSDQ